LRPSPSTLGDLARALTAQFRAAGIAPDEARLDAELLVRSVLEWDRAQWLVHTSDPVPPAVDQWIAPLAAARAAREPMAYVLGRCEFWGLSLEVTSDVLIPRPESEALVELALARLAPDQAADVLDVGTGSGCLALSLAIERPRAHVVATDISTRALTVARRNARRHGISDRIEFRLGSLFEGISLVDLVVSNPPYVALRDRESLPPEVRDHEPAEALFAGADGLDVIRALVCGAVPRIRPGGWLLFEFGVGQAEAVREVLDTGAWRDVAIASDLQGIPRTALARRL
jgi:release factor glutamine methyltransferase